MVSVAVASRGEAAGVSDVGEGVAMKASRGMALFGLVWLLRMRGADCGCAACRRERRARPPDLRLRTREPPPILASAPASLSAITAAATAASSSARELECFTEVSEADRTTHHVAEVCVSADCESETVVTHDATVQTDFEDDDCYLFEASTSALYGKSQYHFNESMFAMITLNLGLYNKKIKQN